MADILSTLYPPIVSTYQPTFAMTSSYKAKVYFSISAFNSKENIMAVQISITNQRTNATVLKKSLYPTGFKVYANSGILTDSSRTSDDKYYIEIANTDIEGGFAVNQYYKVQIRFSSIAPPRDSEGKVSQKIDSWLASNTSYFSEWSTVTLLHGISQPTITLKGFSASQSSEGELTLEQDVLTVIGSLSFADPQEKEVIKKYQVQLYDTKNNKVADSGDLYCDTYHGINEINYTFEYLLLDGYSYILTVDYITNNLYNGHEEYSFRVQQKTAPQLGCKFYVDTNPEIGTITLDFFPELSGTDLDDSYIVFRRASSKTNFVIWEDIFKIPETKVKEMKIEDYTIESGIWYKYCVQRLVGEYMRSPVVMAMDREKDKLDAQPIMLIFDDMYLCASQKQLRIRYNPKITSYKKNLSETKIDTIGSKYPFIKRNGAMEYRQFSISGMITIHNDLFYTGGDSIEDSIGKEDNQKEKTSFAKIEELYGSNSIAALYEKYNQENNINEYNDYIYEREFREAVADFLYEDSVKLLRTTTEGNVLVRLMDINLTPEETLGRMIYSFSATAYEVADCTNINLIKYNIAGGLIGLEEDSPSQQQSSHLLGQVRGPFKKNVDIFSETLAEKHNYITQDNISMTVNKITKLHIELYGNPYLIKIQDNDLIYVDGNTDNEMNVLVGYIVYLNGTPIYINKRGVYDLLEDDTEITSIYFPVEQEGIIDYTIDLLQNMEYKSDMIFYSNKIGQIAGNFNYQESIFNKIWNKYYKQKSTLYQKLISINGMRIEANPGTVIYVKMTGSNELKKFVIDASETLTLYEEDEVITELYFCGVQLYEVSETNREAAKANTAIRTGKSFANLKEAAKAQNLVVNGIYTIQDIAATTSDTIENEYIYYQGHWYPYNNGLVTCSVDAIIDYIIEIVEGVSTS